MTDEAEPFMGSGRFGTRFSSPSMHSLIYAALGMVSSHLYVYMAARAYLLGYNCKDEEELEAALRIC